MINDRIHIIKPAIIDQQQATASMMMKISAASSPAVNCRPVTPSSWEIAAIRAQILTQSPSRSSTLPSVNTPWIYPISVGASNAIGVTAYSDAMPQSAPFKYRRAQFGRTSRHDQPARLAQSFVDIAVGEYSSSQPHCHRRFARNRPAHERGLA
jgi:hypothetical protein